MGMRRIGWSAWAGHAGLGVLLLLSAPFIVYSARFGASGFATDLSDETYLFTQGASLRAGLANAAIFSHMLAGALITLLAPLQLIPAIRAHAPRLHRICGYALAAGAAVAGLGGLAYIALRGTIGGPLMDAGFTLYGLCLLAATLGAILNARAGDFARHRAWALRLFVLAIGSFLYRLHYGLWSLATGGLWSEPDFSGVFDRVQVFAFYLPYLLALEALFLLQRRRTRLRRA